MKYTHAFVSGLLIGMSTSAIAAPTLSADFYATNAIDSVECSVNGSRIISGTIDKTDATKWIPKCDLVSINVTGTYTLVMTVKKAAGCIGNSCFAGGVASSVPFTYNWTSANVPTPALKLEP
jgi:hypothetical protein